MLSPWSADPADLSARIDALGNVPPSTPGPALAPRKRAFFWAITILLPLVITGILAELVLRAVRARQAPTDGTALSRRLAESAKTEVRVVTTGNLKGLVEPSNLEGVVYELKPSRQWVFQGGRTATNSHGFRGHEYALEKPPGTARIVGLGDSIMFGWGVNQEETYTNLLEHDLGTPVRAVEVLNLAVPGFNTMQEAALLEGKGLAFSPDVVLVNYCLNDWAAPFFLPGEKGGIIEKSVLFQLLSERLGRNAEHEYTAMQGMDKVKTALDEIGRLGKQHHFQPVLFIYPQPLDAAEQQHLRGMAEAAGLRYVDLYAPFERYYREHNLSGIEALAIKAGDMHPNPEGHRLIAGILKPTLAELIAR
jgi:lysophospholipase L1-like esterase